MILGLSSGETTNDDDPNLGQLTRDQFCHRVNDALRNSQTQRETVAVLYLDLDGFKAVNSLHGRAVGDSVLQWVGRQFCRAACGAEMVSRVGSDEFACLLLGQPESASLEKWAVRILAAVSEPARFGAVELAMAPSIGIVCCSAGEADADTILRWAASAMYRARHEKLGYAFAQRQTTASPMFQFGSRTTSLTPPVSA